MSVQEGPSTDQRREREGAMIDRASLRLSATLLLAGQLLYILVTQFHTGGEANNHPAIFAAYARSDSWKAVHVGQFVIDHVKSVPNSGPIRVSSGFENRPLRGMVLGSEIDHEDDATPEFVRCRRHPLIMISIDPVSTDPSGLPDRRPSYVVAMPT